MTNLYQYGMVGLGTMGANLVLNMVDKGYRVAGFDKNERAVNALNLHGTPEQLWATADLESFVNILEKPRKIFIMVPAGALVDEVINQLVPLLQPEDLLVDCGNSFFQDTHRRIQQLLPAGLLFMGMGVSGGETGARLGPSIMPGGNQQVYLQIEPLLKAIAAKVHDEPCVAYLGEGAAGHYIKMVHNGIEYGLMQLIAESYHLLKSVGQFDNDRLSQTFHDWNQGRLHAYLIAITAAVINQGDDRGEGQLVDKILDKAQQKGTGAWTSQEAMRSGAAVPILDAAVTQRILSSIKEERQKAAGINPLPPPVSSLSAEEMTNWVEEALYASFILAYAQGLALIRLGSRQYGFNTSLPAVTKVWRGGCIIRADLLELISTALDHDPHAPNILLTPEIASLLQTGMPYVRKLVQTAIEHQIPVPAFSAGLSYYDSYHSVWLPANLIQAQRDFFGAHTYQRIDREGFFHTQWEEKIR